MCEVSSIEHHRIERFKFVAGMLAFSVYASCLFDRSAWRPSLRLFVSSLWKSCTCPAKISIPALTRQAYCPHTREPPARASYCRLIFVLMNDLFVCTGM